MNATHRAPLAFRAGRRHQRRARSCRDLLARSYALRFSDPRQMVEVARLAVAMADGTRDLPPVAWADLRSEAWAHYGNALKVAGSYRRAEAAFHSAEVFWRLGSKSPCLHAQRLQFQAALRMRESRFGEAKNLLGRAADLLEHGSESYAECLIQFALATHEAGDSLEALRLVTRALALVPATNQRLALIARHNGVIFLEGLGRRGEAFAALRLLAELYDQVGDRLLIFRRDWLLAQVCAGRTDLDRVAEAGFRRALVEAQSLALPYEAAKVGLDLACFLVSRKRTAEIAPVVEALLGIFDALGISRESTAARLLRRVCRQDRLAGEFLARAAAAVEARALRSAF
jgi:tetratricopeptide (TPR) repeat protein